MGGKYHDTEPKCPSDHEEEEKQTAFKAEGVLSEKLALTLDLLFRALAPMRSRETLRALTEGIDTMEPDTRPPRSGTHFSAKTGVSSARRPTTEGREADTFRFTLISYIDMDCVDRTGAA